MKKKNRESYWVEDPNEDIIRMWAWVLGAINAGIYAAMPWGCFGVVSLRSWSS